MAAIRDRDLAYLWGCGQRGGTAFSPCRATIQRFYIQNTKPFCVIALATV